MKTSFPRSVCLLLLLIQPLWVGCALSSGAIRAGQDQVPKTTADEEKLTQKIKEEVLRDLREGDWLAQQIELGIQKYVQKQLAAQ